MYHNPVLLKECIEGLELKADGIYVDVTFGGGGHSKAILSQLSGGRLYAFDQDPDAWANVVDDKRLIPVKKNFSALREGLLEHGVNAVDGILADLGVSSHQFDVPQRGFSTRLEGRLDMRMDQQREQDAAKVLNEYSMEALKTIFSSYGEVENAGKLARAIVNAREEKKIETITDIKRVMERCVRPGKENKYYAQVFQALRIEVNEEVESLKQLLVQSLEVLKPGGRLVVISYHSLEDRLVKNFMRSGKWEGEPDKDFYGNVITPWNVISKKAIIPSEEEIATNSRARSAKLRIAEKR